MIPMITIFITIYRHYRHLCHHCHHEHYYGDERPVSITGRIENNIICQ